MKKVIEKNVKEDEIFIFILKKLDNDKYLVLCQVWGKKEVFIRGMVKKNYWLRFRWKIFVDDFGMMNEYILMCVVSGEMCLVLRKIKNN